MLEMIIYGECLSVWFWAFLKYGAHRWSFLARRGEVGLVASDWPWKIPHFLVNLPSLHFYDVKFQVRHSEGFQILFWMKGKNTGEPFTYWENHIKTRFPFITANISNDRTVDKLVSEVNGKSARIPGIYLPVIKYGYSSKIPELNGGLQLQNHLFQWVIFQLAFFFFGKSRKLPYIIYNVYIFV